jgi:hypothetical protein
MHPPKDQDHPLTTPAMSADKTADKITVSGIVVPGHQVASGQSAHNPYPRGTIEMQTPHFQALGVDLTPFYPGTLNVSIAPYRFDIVPTITLPQVKWSPHHAAETFSFVPIRLIWPTSQSSSAQPVEEAARWQSLPRESQTVEGLIYYPHPETKLNHFQDPTVLELLLPKLASIHYGSTVTLIASASELIIKK